MDTQQNVGVQEAEVGLPKTLEVRKPRFDIETGERVEDEIEIISLVDLTNRRNDVLKELELLDKQILLFK